MNVVRCMEGKSTRKIALPTICYVVVESNMANLGADQLVGRGQAYQSHLAPPQLQVQLSRLRL
jgi:hypothetical protein